MPALADYIPAPLAQAVMEQYRLDMDGIHGLQHWIRVWNIGQELAASTGANLDVVCCFAFLHDVCRVDDNVDLLHGFRAAKFITRILQPEYLNLPTVELKLLEIAVKRHTFGQTKAHITVMTCWDADRLDLGRANIRPRPSRLCTAAARDPEMIRRSYLASRNRS